MEVAKVGLKISQLLSEFCFSPTQNDEMCNFYAMYYTNATNGKSFYSCAGNNVPALLRNSIPSDSDTPLPPNPALDGIAEDSGGGGHMHSDRHSSTRISSTNDGYDERPLLGSSAVDGVKGSSGRGFKGGGSSSYDDDSRYVYSKYDPETVSSKSDDSAAADWVKPRGGLDLRHPEISYANARGPEDVVYEYVPEGGGGTDDRSVQDYMDEVAGQRSRSRHRYPVGGIPPETSGSYYLHDTALPGSRYVAEELPVGQLVEDNYEDGTEDNRRRLYSDRLAEDYQDPGLRRMVGTDGENRQELHQINKTKTWNQQRATTVISDPGKRPSWATSGPGEFH